MGGIKGGKKLNRNTGHRIALLRNMACSLIKYESIKTTEAKAKNLKAFIDSLISRAKKNDLTARKRIRQDIHQKDAYLKLFNEIIGRYDNRVGGFVELVKLENRRSDNAPMCLIKLIS